MRAEVIIPRRRPSPPTSRTVADRVDGGDARGRVGGVTGEHLIAIGRPAASVIKPYSIWARPASFRHGSSHVLRREWLPSTDELEGHTALGRRWRDGVGPVAARSRPDVDEPVHRPVYVVELVASATPKSPARVVVCHAQRVVASFDAGRHTRATTSATTKFAFGGRRPQQLGEAERLGLGPYLAATWPCGIERRFHESDSSYSRPCGAVACAIWATRAVAFTTDDQSAVNPGQTAGFGDPDDQPTPGLLQVAPDIKDYQGTANQRARISRAGSFQLRRSGEKRVHGVGWGRKDLAGSA